MYAKCLNVFVDSGLLKLYKQVNVIFNIPNLMHKYLKQTLHEYIIGISETIKMMLWRANACKELYKA